jgi:hypothetical protein
MLGLAVWVTILTEEEPLPGPLSCAGAETARTKKILELARRTIIASASFVRQRGNLLILTLMATHFRGFENRAGATRRTAPRRSCRFQSDADQISWVVSCAHVKKRLPTRPAPAQVAINNSTFPRAANSSSRSPSFCQTNCCSIWQERVLAEAHCSGEQHGRCLTVPAEVRQSDSLVPMESRDGWVAR